MVTRAERTRAAMLRLRKYQYIQYVDVFSTDRAQPCGEAIGERLAWPRVIA
jgi:hypothetical protein